MSAEAFYDTLGAMSRAQWIVLALNVIWAQFMLQAWMVTGDGGCLAAFVSCSATVLWIVDRHTGENS